MVDEYYSWFRFGIDMREEGIRLNLECHGIYERPLSGLITDTAFVQRVAIT